jgi:hypothetical protein
MGLLAFLFGCDEPARSTNGEADASVQDAVDLQMQPLWTAVNGTAFDSDVDLDRKQAKINELSAWAAKTEDRKVRKAQEYWISVAQYTIDHEREDRAKKKTAQKIIPTLPPLPNIPRAFPY